VARNEFNPSEVHDAPNCAVPYCAEESLTSEDEAGNAHRMLQRETSMAQLQENQTSVQTFKRFGAGTQLARNPLGDALLWLPVQLGRIVGMGASAVLDKTLAVWWFAFNNVYGAVSTIESFGILRKATLIGNKFVQWAGIVTFFIWLINDAIFAGMNRAMCPRIQEWIGLMEDARLSGSQKEASDKSEDRPKESRMQCKREVTTIHKELLAQVKEMATTAGRLQDLRGEEAAEQGAVEWAGSWKAYMDYNMGIGDETVDVLQVHKDASDLFEKELQPAALCPIAGKAMESQFQADIEKNAKVKEAACKCKPMPTECKSWWDWKSRQRKQDVVDEPVVSDVAPGSSQVAPVKPTEIEVVDDEPVTSAVAPEASDVAREVVDDERVPSDVAPLPSEVVPEVVDDERVPPDVPVPSNNMPVPSDQSMTDQSSSEALESKSGPSPSPSGSETSAGMGLLVGVVCFLMQ